MAWEFEDLSVNQPQQDNSPAQRWEFEDVNVPSQTVLDDDSGEVYAVPVSFDERDTRFAIETQTKGADKAAKTLFIYHVLLPCLFQWAADGFRWDDKAQLKAALLGSLNGVFALNTVLSKLYDVTLGDGNTFTSDVKVKDVVPFWGSVEELKKQFVKFAEEGITTEDYFDVVKAFAKPVGELSGIPVKYPLDVIKNFGDYADGGEYGKEVLLWLGWSPYALRDLD